jgi:hypothetical protein
MTHTAGRCKRTANGRKEEEKQPETKKETARVHNCRRATAENESIN